MEFLAFSDMHEHNFRYGATFIDCPSDLDEFQDNNEQYKNLNSRFVDTILTLREIRDYAKEHEIGWVLFGGDLFHERSKVSTEVLSVVSRELAKFSHWGIKLVALPGNHDFADREGSNTSLDHLELTDDIFVLSEGLHEFPGLNIYAFPYTQELEAPLRRLKEFTKLGQDSASPMLLLGHVGVQGGIVGSDYVLVSKKDVDFNDLQTKFFDLTLLGHFHKHQKLSSKAYYIGATHEHNWGDCDDPERGFLHVNVSKGKHSVTKIPTMSASRFVKVSTEKDLENVRDNDFVRVIKSSTNTSLEKKARTTSKRVEVLEEELSTTDAKLPKELFDPLAMAEEWVRLHGDGDTDLLDMGTTFIRTVANDGL